MRFFPKSWQFFSSANTYLKLYDFIIYLFFKKRNFFNQKMLICTRYKIFLKFDPCSYRKIPMRFSFEMFLTSLENTCLKNFLNNFFSIWRVFQSQNTNSLPITRYFFSLKFEQFFVLKNKYLELWNLFLFIRSNPSYTISSSSFYLSVRLSL